MADRRRKAEHEEPPRFLRLDEKSRAKMWKSAQNTIFALVVLLFVVLLLGGDFGLISLVKYRRFERRVEQQIEHEKARQDSLRQVLLELSTNEEFKERLARERLRMLKDGEIIYRFEQPRGE
ncbi:MAG TPA: hypothetical protein ENN07_02895 [candidate division Zixibacteria bacterium]|nr:hypothetical protein [candidate division Zixibacteria bacterium]